MNDTDIFKSFDMVVAITQKTINDQLGRLKNEGILPSDLVIKSEFDAQTGKDAYTLCRSEKDLPRNPDGSVDNTRIDGYLDGKMDLSIRIMDTGTTVRLVVRFESGRFGFYLGSGPRAVWQVTDMSDWVFAIPVNLDIAAIAREDMDGHINVPPSVKSQLESFQEADFTVNHLFLDLENSNLATFDPTLTSVGSNGQDALKSFVFFMQEYLGKMKEQAEAGGNPYVLGYVLTDGNNTRYPGGEDVPDMLKPIGVTFNVFKHPTDENLSTVNYCLATKDGKGVVPGTPGNFDSPWITEEMGCDARMIMSHSIFLEAYILRPIFDQLRKNVYEQIHSKLSVSEGQGYDAAMRGTGTGFNYNISDVTSGHNQYVNQYTVNVVNSGDKIDLNFSGRLYFYKEKSKHTGFPTFCTAKAWAHTGLNWGGTVSIGLADGASGQPRLDISQSFGTSHHSSGSDTNTCADVARVFGAILGGILGAFSFGLAAGYFSNLILSALSTHVGSFGNVDVALRNIGHSVSTMVLLPAGGNFTLQKPMADRLGNFYLDLSLKE